METAFRIALTAFLGLGALLTVAIIDKPRKPLTAGTAVITVIINSLIIAGLWWLL